jgi:hypothetical protein
MTGASGGIAEATASLTRLTMPRFFAGFAAFFFATFLAGFLAAFFAFTARRAGFAALRFAALRLIGLFAFFAFFFAGFFLAFLAIIASSSVLTRYESQHNHDDTSM